MPNSLNRVSIGLVDVGPSLWLLSTTSTLEAVNAVGFLGPVASTQNQFPNNGDALFCAASNGSEYYTVSRINGVYTLNPVAGDEGDFNYVNSFWIAQNGLNTNIGTNIGAPFQGASGVQKALSLCTNPAVNYIINIADAGLYAFGNSSITAPSGASVYINAPAATFTSTAGNMFNLTGGAVELNVGLLSNPTRRLVVATGTSLIINSTSITAGSIDNDSGAPAPYASFTINCIANIAANINVATQGANLFKANTISGSFADTSSTSSIRNGLFANDLTGSISSTNTTVYGNVVTVGGSVAGVAQGIFNGSLINIS